VEVARHGHRPLDGGQGDQVVIRGIDGVDGRLAVRIRGEQRRAAGPGERQEADHAIGAAGYAADAPCGRNCSTTSHGIAFFSSRWMERSAWTSSGATSEIAVPDNPARPVRPIRWM